MIISETLRSFIIDNFLFGQANGNLADETSFLDSGIISSTGLLELISFLEQEFGFRVQDEEIVPDNLDSIGKLTAYVEGKLAAKTLEAS